MLYKMKLCRPKNLEEARNNDSYYHCRNGIFQQDSLEVVDNLIVNEKFFPKKYVTEIVTGKKLPLLRMEILLMDRKYSYSLEGIEDAPLFLFYIRQNRLNIPENDIFSKEEVTERTLTEYKDTHCLPLWNHVLERYQNEAEQQEEFVLKKVQSR